MDLFFWFCVSFHQVWALCVSLIYVWKFFFTISAVTCAPKWVCECICRPIVARSEWMLLQQVCLHFKFLYYFWSLKHQYTLKKNYTMNAIISEYVILSLSVLSTQCCVSCWHEMVLILARLSVLAETVCDQKLHAWTHTHTHTGNRSVVVVHNSC